MDDGAPNTSSAYGKQRRARPIRRARQCGGGQQGVRGECGKGPSDVGILQQRSPGGRKRRARLEYGAPGTVLAAPGLRAIHPYRGLGRENRIPQHHARPTPDAWDRGVGRLSERSRAPDSLADARVVSEALPPGDCRRRSATVRSITRAGTTATAAATPSRAPVGTPERAPRPTSLLGSSAPTAPETMSAYVSEMGTPTPRQGRTPPTHLDRGRRKRYPRRSVLTWPPGTRTMQLTIHSANRSRPCHAPKKPTNSSATNAGASS